MELAPSLLRWYLALTPRSVVRGDGNTIYSFSFLCCQLSQDQTDTGPELLPFAWYIETSVCFCYPLPISSWTTVSIAQKVLCFSWPSSLLTSIVGWEPMAWAPEIKHFLFPNKTFCIRASLPLKKLSFLGLLLCFLRAFYGFMCAIIWSQAHNFSTKDFLKVHI